MDASLECGEVRDGNTGLQVVGMAHMVRGEPLK